MKPGRRSSCVGCSYLKRIESSFQPTGTPQCRASSCVILWRWRIVLTQRLALDESGRYDHDIKPGTHWTRPIMKRDATPRYRNIALPRLFRQASRVNLASRCGGLHSDKIACFSVEPLATHCVECKAFSNFTPTWFCTFI